MDLTSCFKSLVLGFGSSHVFGSAIGLVLFLVFVFGTFKFLEVGRFVKGSNLVQLFVRGEKASISIITRDLGKVSPKLGDLISKVSDQRIVHYKCIADTFFCLVAKRVASDNNSEDNYEAAEEDEEFDVASLRAMVKEQRRRAEIAREDLDMERMASASAVLAVMDRIRVLDAEKSLVAMEGKQYRRMAEERLHYSELTVEKQKGVIWRLEQELIAVRAQEISNTRPLKRSK